VVAQSIAASEIAETSIGSAGVRMVESVPILDTSVNKSIISSNSFAFIFSEIIIFVSSAFFISEENELLDNVVVPQLLKNTKENKKAIVLFKSVA
jgi:hypothetical protein